MQKVYLLLRNNQQTGPFDLEELVKFDLKPYDLIWIEGKSAGWYYPQEIKALHPYLPFVTKAAQPSTPQKTVSSNSPAAEKKVFVSMPSQAVKPAQSIADNLFERKETPADTQPKTLHTNYKKKMDEVEADYTSWMYQSKTKKKTGFSKKGLVAACLIGTAAFAAWMLSKEPAPLQTQVVNQQQLLAKADSVSQQTNSAKDEEPTVTSVSKKKKVAKAINENAETSLHQTTKQKTLSEVVAGNKPTVEEAPKQQVPQPIEETSKPETKPETAAPAQKKKIGEKILDLFKKKREAPKQEEGATNDNGERRSARREASTNLATQVGVRFDIPNDWMMGIKGAKAIFTNRSSETITKAVVEVIYYNESNEVVQTKTVSFTNVGIKKTATVSIPDHSFADHLDYKILSIEGSGEPML